MRYIEVSDSVSLETALKRVDGHGRIHLCPGKFPNDILITRPVNITGTSDSEITGNIIIQTGVQTASIDGLNLCGSILTIDSARDVSVRNCRFEFTNTAIKASGINISIVGCEFVQKHPTTPYSVIVASGCTNLDISSNTHSKREASLHTFVKLLSETYAGTIKIHSNNIEVGAGSPGHFIHASILKSGMRKVRFSVVDNTFITSQTASGGFLVIESKNPKLFQEVLDYETPGQISGNRVVNPYRGWVFLDVLGEPTPLRKYFTVSDNRYSGVYTLKPLCHLVNETMMLSNGLGADISKWEHVISTKMTESQITPKTTEGESFLTVIGATALAIFVVFITIMITQKMRKNNKKT